jgi:hypothetical protein
MIELKKKDVDNFVKEGNIHERLGMVISALNVRDRKRRCNFKVVYDKGQVTHTLSSYILTYVPSLADWSHTSSCEEISEEWKTLCTNIAFGWEKLRIIG